jgi:predicted ATPase
LLNKAVGLLQQLPPSRRNHERELALQMALGVSLVVTQGYGDSGAIAAYGRARDLGQQLGQPPIPPVLRALAIAHLIRVELQPAFALGNQLLALAEQGRDTVLRVEAHYVVGVTLFWLGEFAASRAHLEKALAHYDPSQSPTHIALYSQDPKVVCQCRLAFDLWCLGDFQQARLSSQAAIAYARQIGDPYSLAYAFQWELTRLIHSRIIQDAKERAEEVMALCQEHRLAIWGQAARTLHAWTMARQGMFQAGVAEMRASIAVGPPGNQVHFTGLLSELLGEAGEAEQGLAMLADTFNMIERTGERWCEAELHRIRGDLLLLRGQVPEAEAALERALAVARAQQARAFELHASIRLARLWLGQGKSGRARDLLAPLCAWFGQQPDIPDLVEAWALLASLGG